MAWLGSWCSGSLVSIPLLRAEDYSSKKAWDQSGFAVGFREGLCGASHVSLRLQAELIRILTKGDYYNLLSRMVSPAETLLPTLELHLGQEWGGGTEACGSPSLLPLLGPYPIPSAFNC